MPEIEQAIGRYLRDVRCNRKFYGHDQSMSRVHVAATIGMTAGNLWQIELGTHGIRVGQMVALCDALDVDVLDMLRELL